MRVVDGIPVWGDADEQTLLQIRTARADEHAVGAALMADNHLGYGVPIGGVVAYEGAVSPTGVGYDIGCGNMAVRTDMRGSELRPHIGKVMDDVFSKISFGVGRKNAKPVDHDLFDDPAWSLEVTKKRDTHGRTLRGKAESQLGTVGSGNHYVDLFTDEEDWVWIGVHFGSRGLGHTIATHYLEAAGAKDAIMAVPAVLPVGDGGLGDEYLEAMRLAGLYAYAGREWVVGAVLRILCASVTFTVHNHHNWAFFEQHQGRWLWVVRKGATPAWPGQYGFIGGSMGDDAVIIRGRETVGAAVVPQVESLFSTVHGAGRVMSRAAAKGKVRRRPRPVEYGATNRAMDELLAQMKGLPREQRKELGRQVEATRAVLKQQRVWDEEIVKPGAVTREAMQNWITERKVTLRGADLDEAPQAYRRLPAVLAEHEDSIEVLHHLRPVGVAMAGADVVDPFKD